MEKYLGIKVEKSKPIKTDKEEIRKVNERKRNLRKIGFSIATKNFRCETCKTSIPEGTPYLAIKNQPYFSEEKILHTTNKYCPRCQIKMELENKKKNFFHKMKITVYGSDEPICWKCGKKIRKLEIFLVDQRIDLICEEHHTITLIERGRMPLGFRKP